MVCSFQPLLKMISLYYCPQAHASQFSGFSSLSWAHTCICGPFRVDVQPCWSLLGSLTCLRVAGLGWSWLRRLDSVPCGLSVSSRLAFFIWSWQCFKRTEAHKVSWGWKLAHCPFCYIVLTKASHKASQDWRREEELQSRMAKGRDTGRPLIKAFNAIPSTTGSIALTL